MVNALARQVTQVEAPLRSQPITAELIDRAKDALILRRDTHIDSLADKLHEPRVRRIIEAVLVGEDLPMDMMNDDLVYVRDLGLVAPTAPVRIANPIYAEVIPRTLSYLMQE